MKNVSLTLKNGKKFIGKSFGYEQSVSGEVVFTTGMVGYPESMTDPSYAGQILIFTYPMIGNYGVPEKKYWESDRIHTKAIIVSSYIPDQSHLTSNKTLSQWLIEQKIPGLIISDTRELTQVIRTHGTLLGKIEFENKIDFYNPDIENLPKTVSTPKIIIHKSLGKTFCNIALIDCGVKQNIIRSLVGRKCNVTQVPWNFDIIENNLSCDGVVISNGPGDPKILTQTIINIQKCLQRNVPIFGICLGNQLLALAAGGDTRKMKFGHRSQNQPCKIHDGSNHYYLTTQNHGFEISRIPQGFKPWFTNANDQTNEGIIHTNKPFMSVQFHPEACPGPTDTDWIFDWFLKRL